MGSSTENRTIIRLKTPYQYTRYKTLETRNKIQDSLENILPCIKTYSETKCGFRPQHLCSGLPHFVKFPAEPSFLFTMISWTDLVVERVSLLHKIFPREPQCGHLMMFTVKGHFILFDTVLN